MVYLKDCVERMTMLVNIFQGSKYDLKRERMNIWQRVVSQWKKGRCANLSEILLERSLSVVTEDRVRYTERESFVDLRYSEQITSSCEQFTVFALKNFRNMYKIN